MKLEDLIIKRMLKKNCCTRAMKPLIPKETNTVYVNVPDKWKDVIFTNNYKRK